MILDKMDPPPRYTPKASAGELLTLLPPHVLLQIVYRTIPQIIVPGPNLERQERQRKTLYWLSTGLRLVNRAFYIASMHVLRSTYLPHFLSLVRPPHTSDPFPVTNDFSPGAAPLYAPGSSAGLPSVTADPLHSIQRESIVLDLFIVLKVREDVWSDDSELHLEREESFRDLFDLHQPRSRLEDLVRIYGTEDGVVTLQKTTSRSASIYSTPTSSTVSLSSPSKTQQPPQTTSRSFFFRRSSKAAPTASTSARPPIQSITPIPFASLSISFTARKVSLMIADKQRKRSIVEVQRDRQDRLETTARQLVFELRRWLQEGGRVE